MPKYFDLCQKEWGVEITMKRSRKLVRIIKMCTEGRFILRAAKIILVFGGAMITFSGCTTLTGAPSSTAKHAVVMPGDRADVQFTCRLTNGEVAMSTYQEVADDPSLRKSVVFVKRDRSTPLKISAGNEPEQAPSFPYKGLENEVIYQMSSAVVGLPIGEKQTLEIKAERLPEQQPGEHLVKISRVRRREKEMRFTPDQYEASTGRAAEVGRAFLYDPALPGEVESVSDTEVVVQFAPEPGKEVTTAFGKATVREQPDCYEIVIDARPGDLVRTGGIVGRIVEVDDKEITIDYGHPFGGGALLCDVVIESVSPPSLPTSADKRAEGQAPPRAAH